MHNESLPLDVMCLSLQLASRRLLLKEPHSCLAWLGRCSSRNFHFWLFVVSFADSWIAPLLLIVSLVSCVGFRWFQ